MISKTCQNCAFWHRVKKSNQGKCVSPGFVPGNASQKQTFKAYAVYLGFNAGDPIEFTTGQDFGCIHWERKRECMNCKHFQNYPTDKFRGICKFIGVTVSCYGSEACSKWGPKNG